MLFSALCRALRSGGVAIAKRLYSNMPDRRSSERFSGTTTAIYRILIVDDHPLIRRSVVQILADGFPGSQISEAADPVEALRQVWAENWDLVVLDVSLPGRSGLELLRDIKAARNATSVLILSAHPETQFATRMLRSGAAGYLTKDSPPDLLLQAARQIIGGGKFITPSVAEILASEIQVDAAKSPHELLSDREYLVMMKIASGSSVTEISEVLKLSVKTVSTYRTRLLSKLALKNNAEIAHYAIRNHLID